ncbi:Glycosyl hydrolases family 43 [Pedobacter westerhofensis]|uniref:Glycosyl hydrolases family 43 n=1 Tax=Pedobacter westerhofensis TaxID=425512 RepID=A0A521FBY6_9SPHI|nr:family 43 glycosylhydrolase [Pedobacter westerhofensis]SMO93707.1 Glycosyl hydrolases family 43 [Pedobacter westerhofensis]
MFKKEWLRPIACLSVALCSLSTADAQNIQNPGKDNTAYLFTYFVGGKGGESIRFALSNDGYHYRALNQNKPVLNPAKTSATGGVRDPHILRGADGKTFYMVATDMNTEKYGWDTPDSGMVLMKSRDLINWSSHVVNIPALFKEFAGVNRVWAPQTIYDPQQKKYMIYWSMRTGKDADKIYYAYANKDFTGLDSAPKQLFYKADGGACIDGDIVYKDGRYHLFFKTEGSGAGIKIAVSDQLTKGYVLLDKYVQQTTSPVEGSGTYKLNNSDDYILMYDRYTEGKYQFTRSKDLVNFKAIDDEIAMNFRPRHGTIMPVTTDEAKKLAAQWMNPDDMILAAQAKEVKKINISFDTASKKAYIPVMPGTKLNAFDPQFTTFPGIIISPGKAQDFTHGPVKYTVDINGKKQSYDVFLQENHNAAIPGYYADPDILYAEKTGKFYIYPTSDGYNNWSGNYFKTFSSADLVNWKDEGVILDLPKDVSWAKKNAWAPCIIEKKINGSYKYFFYFTAGAKIGVAISDNPAGPFVDSGKALIDKFPDGIKGGQQIDPDVFSDPKTGKTYLYWGNGYMAGAELNEDMISLKSGTTKVLTPKDNFKEGTYVAFRKGIYYFMWSESDTRNPNYTVHYGTSDSALGEISVPKNNVVIAKNPKAGIYGTGHHSVIQIPGTDEWYIVYHRFNYPAGISMGEAAGYNREICIDRLTFNEDGSIREVIPTHEGISPVKLK